MDVFQLREQVVADYRTYVRSFLRINDDEIKAFVDRSMDEGRLWPDPLVQLNPAYESGGTIEELAKTGILHEECAAIFRRRAEPGDPGITLRLHRHQRQALDVAPTGASYVLTTGTGSGKSLAYFVPIVDHVLRRPKRSGITAIVVYPMNALANSQLKELEKFLTWAYGAGKEPVTFARYTGQESRDRRAEIAASPPDILLTNYVMLELLMTRVDPSDRKVIEAARGLEFLVLDELHTYRGRQGADVAMLVRRVRERLGAANLRCVGTSATIAGAPTREQRQVEVAAVASRLFGTDVLSEHVIGETLRPAIERTTPDADELRDALLQEPVRPDRVRYQDLIAHPLAAWVETAFGLQRDAQGRLERRKPQTVGDAARALSALTGVPVDRCRAHLQQVLLAGYRVEDPATSRKVFAFRLHQFVSRGDTVYASLEPAGKRHLSLEGQVFVPGSREKRLYPLSFCRECGQSYAVVDFMPDGSFEPRELSDVAPQDSTDRRSGFLYLDERDEWSPEPLEERLPEDWLEAGRDGFPRVKSANRKWVPTRLLVRPDGAVAEEQATDGMPAWFVPTPFRFCLGCGVAYSGKVGDFVKLAELATEGRSTATTVLSLAIVRGLRDVEGIDEQARKLLSFTDNRQDASLQAGHFNDFIQVSLLRGALYAAVIEAGGDGVGSDVIAQRVTASLALDFHEYASNPAAAYLQKSKTEQALRDVIGYRIFRDLRRGWRVNAPNLEQTGLLKVQYEALAEVCADEDLWRDRHWALRDALPAERERACETVLDYFRRELAIKVPYLDPAHQEALRNNAFQYLVSPWGLEEDEELLPAKVVRVGTRDPRARFHESSISAMSALGRYLRRRSTWASVLSSGLHKDELEPLASDILGALTIGGHVEPVGNGRTASTVYQLNAGAIRWTAGDGAPEPDPLRIARASKVDLQINEFFHDLYHHVGVTLRRITAHEHTAQVPAEKREDREDRFRQGKLAVLYCSPTMELGVDIADLNAVNMRNVPPTPANYAQRSGRAGRSGQPALVLTYCSSYAPHDQYFFRRQPLMVAGEVSPPRIDLANEDLVRSHFHAVWLAETGQSLGHSLKDVLDLSHVDDGVPLLESVAHALNDPYARARARQRCEQLLASLADDLGESRWFGDDWLKWVIDLAPASFDQACERWRQLYRSARRQQETQNAIMLDHAASPDARRQAERLRGEAETQLKLLTDEHGDVNSDFYSYRYFASEGFLPGYNFPRLPLAAYLPGRIRKQGRDEFVSRARFVAISEFGPRNIVYYEGSRFRVDKVIVPPRDVDTGSVTVTAKICAVCGYGHVGEDASAERCHACRALLDGGARYFSNLFRMQNVSTRRVDRITSDEEERLRLGYELMTAYRFAQSKDGPVSRRAAFELGDEQIAHATYAPTATLWRINLGWTRRKERAVTGFLLDLDKGTWARQEVEPQGKDSDLDAPPETVSNFTRIVPFVEDHRNALLFQLAGEHEPATLATLKNALERGIAVRFQLEDSELDSDLLPTDKHPTAILLYEAAEGGAGVLGRLVDDPNALAEVARAALDVCHFDPETGEDRHRAEGANEDCEAACYSCLLSYTNQREHRMLDRQIVRDLLLELSRATGKVGTGSRTREQHRDDLLGSCESNLERRFVQFLYDGGFRLPDQAQPYLADFGTRPDFYYDETMACVYVDGPYHEFPERAERDRAVTAKLEDGGYGVIRVTDEAVWLEQIAAYGWVFGGGTN